MEMVDCEDATGDWAPVDLQVSMRQLVIYALPTSTASKSPHGRILPGHPLLSADCMRLLKGETLNMQLLEREESHVTRGGHHDPTTITPEPVSPQSPQSLETPSGNTNQDKDLHGALLRQSSNRFTNKPHAADSRALHVLPRGSIWGGLADLKGVVRIFNRRIMSYEEEDTCVFSIDVSSKVLTIDTCLHVI